MTTLQAGLNPSPFVAGEIRAIIGRKGITARDVALRLNRPAMWMSRRIGRNADVELTFEDVAKIAQALDVEVEGLIVDALRACRDSNPKPSDLWSDRTIPPLPGICPACHMPHPAWAECQGHPDTQWTLAA